MTPQFVVSPSDVERAFGALQGLRGAGNPVKFAAKLAGLGESEWRAGIPTWAWMTLALGVGIYVGAAHFPKIQDKLGL
jgi:hypothetical protein